MEIFILLLGIKSHNINVQKPEVWLCSELITPKLMLNTLLQPTVTDQSHTTFWQKCGCLGVL